MVNTGRHKVLVDTGADGLTSNTGRLLLNLQAVGIGTGDIDTVILTHGHDETSPYSTSTGPIGS